MRTRCEQDDSATGAAAVPDVAVVGLFELWLMFLRIASTSFGGFMAMISVVQNVVVERRKLLRNEDVLDGLSLATLLPGPTAINVVAYVGYRLRGVAGAAVCVCAAVLPAFLLMLVLSFAYFRWGQVSLVSKAFMGMVPTVAAIIAAAAWRMLRKSALTALESALTLAAVCASLAFGNIQATLAVMAVSAVAGYLRFGKPSPVGGILSAPLSAASAPGAQARMNPSLPALVISSASVVVVLSLYVVPDTLFDLFGAFAGMGLLMFGGGYVFIPLLEQTVVGEYGWVTRQEFIDAIALGQVTPGPVMISATFIGYKVAGFAGAVTATIAMFVPPAIVMILSTCLFSRARTSIVVQAALRGVRAAMTGMVIAAVVVIGKSAAPHWISVALFAVSLAALMRYRIEALWVVPAAAVAGAILY